MNNKFKSSAAGLGLMVVAGTATPPALAEDLKPFQELITGHGGTGPSGANLFEITPPSNPNMRCIVAVGKWQSGGNSISCYPNGTAPAPR